jgi:hypothetical protein
MSHSRVLARNLVCRILLSEETSGIRDIVRDSENENYFTAVLAEMNSKSFNLVQS